MGKKKGTSAFPVARIKKMMQADEDVGKIATLTPTLVGKALECMIEDVLTAASAVTHERRAKTIQPAHLREAIDSAEKFDFLRSTLARVPLAEGNAGRAPRTPKSAKLEGAVPGAGQDGGEKKVDASLKRPRSPGTKATKVGLNASLGKRPRGKAPTPEAVPVLCASDVTSPLPGLSSVMPSLGSGPLMQQSSMASSAAEIEHDDDEDYDEEEDDGEAVQEAKSSSAVASVHPPMVAPLQLEAVAAHPVSSKLEDTPESVASPMDGTEDEMQKYPKLDEPIQFAPAPRIYDPIPVAMKQQQPRSAASVLKSDIMADVASPPGSAADGNAPAFTMPNIPLTSKQPAPTHEDDGATDRHGEHTTTKRVSVMSLLS